MHQDYIAVTFIRFFQPPLPGLPIAPACASFSTTDDNPILVEADEFFLIVLNSTDRVNIIAEESVAKVFIKDNDGKYLFPLSPSCHQRYHYLPSLQIACFSRTTEYIVNVCSSYLGATVNIQSTSVTAMEGNDGDFNRVDICLNLVDVFDGLERELQFNLSVATLVTAGMGGVMATKDC